MKIFNFLIFGGENFKIVFKRTLTQILMLIQCSASGREEGQLIFG